MMKYYRCIYHFNALHSMNGKEEQKHSHTFTIKLSVRDIVHQEMFDFNHFENIVQVLLSRYQGKYLNELPEFKKKPPTIENIGDIFYNSFKMCLESEGYQLYRLEIDENPLAEYSVAEEILLPLEYLGDCKTYWTDLIKMKK